MSSPSRVERGGSVPAGHQPGGHPAVVPAAPSAGRFRGAALLALAALCSTLRPAAASTFTSYAQLPSSAGRAGAVALDPSSGTLFIGTATAPARVAAVAHTSPLSLTDASNITLPAAVSYITDGVFDPFTAAAYFVTESGHVVRVPSGVTPLVAGVVLSLQLSAATPLTAVAIDSIGGFLYVLDAGNGFDGSSVYKVNIRQLSAPFMSLVSGPTPLSSGDTDVSAGGMRGRILAMTGSYRRRVEASAVAHICDGVPV
jgi:hypothetical protein